MEKEGELGARRVGRAKLYRATTFADAEIDAGLQKIFRPGAGDWDGRWTIVHLNLRAPSQRVIRERVVALLAVEGFALAGHDFYIHPRDVGGRVAAALSTAARPHVLILRGHLEDTAPVQTILAMWRIPELERRYRRVLVNLRELERAIRSGVSDEEAFLLRYALVFSFLGVAWDDPGLPAKALPNDWPGEKARQLAARLYRKLEGPALRHAHQLLARSAPPPELIASGSST
jgi:phenylacetic acid degradation operon negative regulatory protein